MGVPTGGMTFKNMQDEIISFRFREANRGSVKRWLNHRYQMVWAHAFWPFKLRTTTNLTVTSGDIQANYSSGGDVLRTLNVFDDLGNQLDYLTPREFERVYEGSTSTGTPCDYTVINGIVLLGPTPNSSATFTASAERRIAHFNSSDSRTTGLMSDDNDYPLFSPEYHYILPLGAMATGLKMSNDPTWESLEGEFASMLQTMRQDLLPADRGETIVYGGVLSAEF